MSDDAHGTFLDTVSVSFTGAVNAVVDRLMNSSETAAESAHDKENLFRIFGTD
jgi:hypothetical protein